MVSFPREKRKNESIFRGTRGYQRVLGMARTRAKTEADAAKAKDEERERKLNEQLDARERGKLPRRSRGT